MTRKRRETCPAPSCASIGNCRKEVRFYLAAHGASMFLAGMATFMFALCSQSPEHLHQLGVMLGAESAKNEHVDGKLKVDASSSSCLNIFSLR